MCDLSLNRSCGHDVKFRSSKEQERGNYDTPCVFQLGKINSIKVLKINKIIKMLKSIVLLVYIRIIINFCSLKLE